MLCFRDKKLGSLDDLRLLWVPRQDVGGLCLGVVES